MLLHLKIIPLNSKSYTYSHHVEMLSHLKMRKIFENFDFDRRDKVLVTFVACLRLRNVPGHWSLVTGHSAVAVPPGPWYHTYYIYCQEISPLLYKDNIKLHNRNIYWKERNESEMII